MVFEVMKGQHVDRKRSEMEECTISEFLALIYKFMRMRNPHKPVNTTRHLEEKSTEVYTITVSDKREKKQEIITEIEKKNFRRGYEELWEALCGKEKSLILRQTRC